LIAIDIDDISLHLFSIDAARYGALLTGDAALRDFD